ncbi:hypothetical protein ACFQVC_29945 [Streptomyces monticola]|uniref:Uncharacterized protein n=1 Tax=Streptomyces monticola TaxID=2666263 RepID=A0ABW2JS07_9ACTN
MTKSLLGKGLAGKRPAVRAIGCGSTARELAQRQLAACAPRRGIL